MTWQHSVVPAGLTFGESSQKDAVHMPFLPVMHAQPLANPHHMLAIEFQLLGC